MIGRIVGAYLGAFTIIGILTRILNWILMHYNLSRKTVITISGIVIGILSVLIANYSYETKESMIVYIPCVVVWSQVLKVLYIHSPICISLSFVFLRFGHDRF